MDAYIQTAEQIKKDISTLFDQVVMRTGYGPEFWREKEYLDLGKLEDEIGNIVTHNLVAEDDPRNEQAP